MATNKGVWDYHSNINIAMFRWSRTRGCGIIIAILMLQYLDGHEQGCDIIIAILMLQCWDGHEQGCVGLL